ncbi:cadherin-24-like [Thunnus albacares]|uniref:cadherin-24-like n=1 Tax=Thunnus albacares TaxID=8236 RepID=UPI001CF6D023|nr:cadherin-24-like [Thunnus albacares]
MAAHIVLLFLLLCKGERNGISVAAGLSEEVQDLQEISSKTQQVLHHPESTDNSVFFMGIKEEDERRTPPNVAFRLNDRKPNGFDFKSIVAGQTVILEHPESAAKSLIPKHSPELSLNHEKRSNLTNGEVEGVINDHSLAPSSEEEFALQPELHLETGVDVLPERTRGRSKWVTKTKDSRSGSYSLKTGPRSRRRRSWLWNQFFVIEEYRGPEPVLIGRLHTDMDKGDGRTKYMLEGEGVGSVFVIDSNTGNIHVTKSLDREEKDQYRLIATATDRQTGRALEPSSEFIIRVQDINDNPPVFPDEPYVAMVPEMANIGTSIIQVTARDADDPTYGNSARLVYAITQGQDYFSVDPQTGVLRTAVPDMDRETQDEYLVLLQAKDMGGHLGGLSGTTTVTVKLSDVNDNPPHFRRSAWSFSVSELAAPGVEVGRLTATDPDLGENAQLEFTILDAEEAEIFNITGRDQEAVIELNKLLDYESCNSYSFIVEVSNPVVDARYLRKGPFKDQATVRVMVLNADEPPQFSQARYHLDVSENCPPVCSVGRVFAVDPDTGQSTNIRYSIDPQSDPEALFRIASDTGFISTVMELDREQEQWHNITVIATQRDNPNLVSRVVVAIETLDQNDNAPELDRQYATSVCDSSAPGQVVQVLRAIDRDQGGGQDTPVHFSIPPESSSALNLTIRETGGVTASLVLQSALEPLPGFSSSLLTLYVPVVLRDGASGLTNTGTVTVTICPCLRGGMQTEDRGRQRDQRWERHMVCLPVPSTSPSLIFSLVTLLAMLACVTTLLVVCALSLSLRHQKRDSHSPFEEDDVRENIISYDDEGGGEADTAAFDITALQSMHRIQHMHNNRNIWYTQQNLPRARTYSWSRNPRPGLDPHQRPGSAPLYGRLCYGIHTLPVLRDYPAGPLEAGLQLTQLTHGLTGGHIANPLVIQNQSTFEPLLHSPEMSPGSYEAEHMLAESKITERNEVSEANAADTKQNQDQAKIDSTESESTPANNAANLTYCDPNESSCQSHTSCSSNQQEGRPGSSQTQISTGATSCTVDDFDTDSSIPSVSERNYSNGSQISSSNNPPVYLKGDTYSIVGSLNPNSRGTCINGTSSSGLYPAGAQLLNMCRLQRKDLTPQPLPLPGGMFGNNRGWACGAEPARTEATNPQPLRMEDLLNFRLDQVTFDLSQPPYDSLQTYEFEGRDSRAESLSSLESDEEKDEGRVVGGMEELNQKFQRLVEIIREREKEKEQEGKPEEGGENAEATLNETHKQTEEKEQEQQRWDF